MSKKITEEFPDLEVLEKYIIPVTSESLGQKVDTDRMWRREVDVVKIAQCCEKYFEWGYRKMIIRRFRTFLWRGVCMRVLRRAVVDSDEKEVDAYRRNRIYQGSDEDSIMATPRKTGRRAHEFAVGTPSGLIQHYFKDMQHVSPSKAGCHFDGEHGDEYGGEGKKLLTRITRSREHGSTDGLLEYRVEVYPTPLVRLAESGIKGVRSPPQDDLGPEDGEGEEGGDKGDEEGDEREGGSEKEKLRKPPPDPEAPMLLWLPAVMLEMAEPGIVEEFERIEDAKSKKKQAIEHLKKARVEGKVVPRHPKPKSDAESDADAESESEHEYPATPTKRNGPTTSKRKGDQLAIATAFKVTRKKPMVERDKGKGKNKFVMSSPDTGDSEEGDKDMLSPDKLFNSFVGAAPKPTAKRTMFDELLDDVIGSSPPKSSYRPKSFEAPDENPFLNSTPAPPANKSQGKTKPVIVAVTPKPKSQAPDPPPTTARKRAKVLFAQNPDHFLPPPSLRTDEEEDLDLYAGFTSIPSLSLDERTIPTSTKASGSRGGRSNATGWAASVGSGVPKDWVTVGEGEAESFEDALADVTPIATSKRPKSDPKAQASATSNGKQFRFIQPESPTSEPDLESRAPLKPKGKEKRKARSASSRNATTTAEDTGEGEEGGVRKRSRKSRVGDPPLAGERVEPPWLDSVPWGDLVPPMRVPALIELPDSDEDEAPAPVTAPVKPTIKINDTTKSRKKNTKGASTSKAKIASESVIDLDSN